MAVADFGIAIRPRNKRRLTSGAIALGVIAVVATGVALVLRPPPHSGTASSAGSTHAAAPKLVTQQLVYGMTKAEVLRRVGRPAKTVGACWQYNENVKIRGGENTLNAERVCFLSGVYSYEYSQTDGKWFYPTTPLTLPPGLGN